MLLVSSSINRLSLYVTSLIDSPVTAVTQNTGVHRNKNVVCPNRVAARLRPSACASKVIDVLAAPLRTRV